MRGVIINYSQLSPGSLYVMWGVIINYSQLSPGSLCCAGRDHHL